VASGKLLAAGAAGVCRGVTAWILPLLIPELYEVGLLKRLVASKVEQVDLTGIECFRLCGSSEDSARFQTAIGKSTDVPDEIEIWVDKSSFMIRKATFRVPGDVSDFVHEAYFDYAASGTL
jgi:hypothetical protein